MKYVLSLLLLALSPLIAQEIAAPAEQVNSNEQPKPAAQDQPQQEESSGDQTEAADTQSDSAQNPEVDTQEEPADDQSDDAQDGQSDAQAEQSADDNESAATSSDALQTAEQPASEAPQADVPEDQSAPDQATAGEATDSTDDTTDQADTPEDKSAPEQDPAEVTTDSPDDTTAPLDQDQEQVALPPEPQASEPSEIAQPTSGPDGSDAPDAQDAKKASDQQAQPVAQPAVPAPAAPAQKVEEPAKEVKEVADDEGISTIDQEGGNWLLKRRALEKTVDAIEMINGAFTKILDSRMDFMVKRNSADRAFDQFVQKNGFKVGQLMAMLEELVKSLERERSEQGALTADEREALRATTSKITAVKQVQKNLEALTKLDASIDEVMMQVEQEVKKSHSYQMHAWQNFQTIKKVLSDEKAEQLYLETDGLYKNMQDIQKYLTNELKNYFEATIKKLNDTMASMQTDIDALKRDGIDLSEEVKKLEGQDQEITLEIDVQERVPLKAEKPKGWFDTISIIWRYPVEKIGQFFSWVGSIFK